MQTIKNAVVVTRHAGLVDYLKSQSIIDDTATIIEHAQRLIEKRKAAGKKGLPNAVKRYNKRKAKQEHA